MSNRQERKQEQKMKAVAKTMADNMQFQALDLIHGMKATWSKKEREDFAAWLLDEEAGPWG